VADVRTLPTKAGNTRYVLRDDSVADDIRDGDEAA
jgi:hypothetical protein